MSRRVQLLYFDAGGGHAAAARALQAVLEQREGWAGGAVERVNLQEKLDPLDPLKRLFGLRLEDFYNELLAREWTLGFAQAARILQAAVRLRRRSIEGALEKWFAASRPDLVVSLIPHFNPYLARALRRSRPGAKFALVLTDMADAVPSFWLGGLEPGAQGSPHIVFCGTSEAARQARAEGIGGERVVQVSGMILRPAFYDPRPGDAPPIGAARRQLGLEEDWPTALVLAGGAGAKRMLEIAVRLDEVKAGVQAIFMVGRNSALAGKLRSRRSRHPQWVQEFTQEVPAFMRLADFFVGKPGPGSLSEAVQMKLPAIVVADWRTLPQERFNARWIEQERLGVALRSWADLPAAVESMLRGGGLEVYRRSAAQHENRAVFEIGDRLQALMERAPS